MDALDLARWQFAVTTLYHFIFVPLTIGLSALIAVLQTVWVRTGRTEYLRATKFFGKLFLINFAMGVVTGIVQEFQFGMNWSTYSRFVGDIFGAPLAIEGLVAFFLESTFLGLWIFGWDRLPRRIHLACIWLVAIGTQLSAYFILAANSWMQHPVGFRYNAERGRAELTDFLAVLTNSTALVTFAHTFMACFVTAGAFMLAVAAWHLRRRNQPEVFRPALRLAGWVMLVAGVGVMVTGDLQARVMTDQQPMKMAAAEALYTTTNSASFSLFTIGSLDGHEEIYSLRVPKLLSFMATGTLDGEVAGVNDLQKEYEAQVGAGNFRPYIPVTYWSFRLMIGFGVLSMLVAALTLWHARRTRDPDSAGGTGGAAGPPRRLSRWVWPAAIWAAALPLLANSMGWIFTEMGRQPWVVFGVLKTSDSVSPKVGAGDVALSLAVFTVLYGILAAVEFALLLRYARAGAPPEEDERPAEDEADRPLTFAY